MNSSGPFVSIIMTAFNEEKYINEAIASVLNQTYENFEFIIVNDGSTDRTEEIINSFKDSRIKYIKNEKNLKLIASLNIGLSAATGEYIARMDADDICLPIRLQTQVEFMNSNPDIGISGSQLTIFGNSNGEMKYPIFHEDIKLGLFITSCFGNNVVMFRRSIFEKHKLFYPTGYFHAEDYKCWTSWVLVTKTQNLDLPLVKYRSHANSVSIQNKGIQRNTRNRVRIEYLTNSFNLLNDQKTANDFYGKTSMARIKSIKNILKINDEQGYFSNIKFGDIVMKLWYLDCLEEAETDFFAVFRYPLIFIANPKASFLNWVFVLKHYLKLRFANKTIV